MLRGLNGQRYASLKSFYLIKTGHVVVLNEGVSLLDSHGGRLGLLDDHATQRREGPFVDPIVVLPKPRTLQRFRPVGSLLYIRSLRKPELLVRRPAIVDVEVWIEDSLALSGIRHDVEIPNIAGQHSSYLRNQLMAFKRERKHPEMRSIALALSDEEIDELVVYYSTLPAR